MVAGLLAGAGACVAQDNRLPILATPHVATDEDTPVDIHVLDGAVDPDGDDLTVISASASGHRAEVIDGKIVRLTPMKDFHGTISVTYGVSDGHALDATGVAIVMVRSVNDAPTAGNGVMNVQGHADIVLPAADVDGDALTYQIENEPSHGTLSGTPPMVRYVPAPDFTGDDSFTFQVSDGSVTSDVATFQLHVTADTAPVAVAGVVSATEDQPIGFVLQGTDADNDSLTFKLEAMPQHGTISGAPPHLFYQPDLNFNGDDSLQFSVSDGARGSDVATMTIHVAPVNDGPSAMPQTVEATEDTPIDITLAASDVDGDPLTFQIQAGPANGTLTTSTGTTFTYRPRANYQGPDSFSFTVSDGHVNSSQATVTIHVAAVNDPPTVPPSEVILDEDSLVLLNLFGNDVDHDPLTFTVTTQPSHGTLRGTPPSMTYTPDANFNGTDSFAYTASDGIATSAPGTVTLDVVPVNDRPVAIDSSVTTPEDTPVTVALQATDIDSPQLTFSIVAAPGDGTFTLSGANLTYTPARDTNGTRSFTFRVSDGSLTANGTVTIQITPVNDPPIAKDDWVATDPGVALTIDATANDVDPEGDAFQIDSFDQPAHGTVALVGGKLVYTSAGRFTGVDGFGYTVSDAHGAASTAQVHVGVGRFPVGAPTETLLRIVVDSGDRDNAPSISGDGRFIAFSSFQPVTDDDTNGVSDCYVYDRGTRTVSRVSVASDGTEGNGDSTRPRISADGGFVVFESNATNLVDGDDNSVSDVFRHDLATGETIRVSVATGGGEANGGSSHPVISDDGSVVAFTSAAFNLVSGDANGASDVFARDVPGGTTARISASQVSGDGDLGSSDPAISGDGRFVSFTSSATNLVPGDSNNVSDVFVRDRTNAATALVSQSTSGQLGDRFSNSSSISGDGRFVSFVSQATNLVAPPPTVLNEAYVRDTTGRVTTRPSPASLSVIWARLSGDGRYLTQQSSTGVQVIDRFTPTTSTLNTGSIWQWPTISRNGRYIAVLDHTGGVVSVTVIPNPL